MTEHRPPPKVRASSPANQRAIAAGQERRRLFLERFRETGDLDDACAAASVSRSTYSAWRQRDPQWSAEIDALRSAFDAEKQELVHVSWKGRFADFGREFFGRKYAWFHLLAAEAFEAAAGGDVVMFLWAPQHGKTTLAEDYANYKLAVDPSFRITVGTETGDLGEKMLQRIKMRMEADGPAKSYVRRFGPFTPASGSSRKTTQPWANDHFNVWKKGQHDERDYSMQSLGMRSSVIGTRCDLMLIDDPQSRKTLGVTDFLLDVIRGDWLTRPGVEGHTVFNGSRQGEDDIYVAMQKAGIVDRLIKLPAYDEERTKTHGTPWLWPEMYSEADYLRLRRNAGEEVWERTYLQRDGLTLDATFTSQMLGPCHNPLRAIWHDPPSDVRSIYISLDPSISGPNGIMVAGATERTLYVLRCLSVRGLNSNQAILGQIEELCHEFHTEEHPVTDLIIEVNAFQKGMMDDTKLHELINRFGFRVSPHTTGLNKHDVNLGVGQMPHSFLREEIDLPYADDPSTRAEIDELEKELRMWRPYVLGKKLRQDRVMALWFCWMLWRQRRRTLKDAQQGSAQWKHGGLPWKPTKSGLIVVGR